MARPEVVAEPLENGTVLRVEGNEDAYLYAEADYVFDLPE